MTAGRAFTIACLVTCACVSSGAQPRVRPTNTAGVPATGVFQDAGGFVVMEMESLPLPADGAWVKESDPRFAPFTGDGYLRATVKSRTQDRGVLTFRVSLATAGDWRLVMRGRHDNPRPDLENDVFLRIDDGPWLKFWAKNLGRWDWSDKAHELDKDHRQKTPIAGTLAAGLHTIVVAARSAHFRLDRMALFLEPQRTRATALETPPSPVVSGIATRPNMLVVLTDDQRWDSLGLAGHPFLRTPHIDRIGREGVVFDNAFVTTPVCSPARASLLTGQYAHTHGVAGNADASALSHRLETFPRRLQAAGYRTAYVGKWHMGNDDSPRPGFDHWVSFSGQGVYEDPTLNVDGRRIQEKGYLADLLTERALAFIERAEDRPFCLIVAHKGPHSPFVPAPRHADLHADAAVPRRPNTRDDLSGKPVLRRALPDWPPVGPGTGPGDEQIKNQLRTLSAIDEGVGRLLEALSRRGQLDSTAIVFTSDHGYFWGEHGLSDKRAAYEEALRVPLLLRYPRVAPAGRRVAGLALNIDLAPTLLALAGLDVPGAIQGRSLLPLVTGGEGRGSFLAEYWVDPNQPRIPTWQAVRTGRWKYIRYPTLPGFEELYDLEADAHELHNLVAHPAAAGARRQLEGELARLLAETGHRGRRVVVEGVLVTRWQAQTVRGWQDARTRTKASLLADGNFNSGFVIVSKDGRQTPLAKDDRAQVLAYLTVDPRERDLRVRAELYEEQGERSLIRLERVGDPSAADSSGSTKAAPSSSSSSSGVARP